MIADGKHIAQIMEEKLAKEFFQLSQKKVCFVLLGNDPASKKFIEMKSKVAVRLGIAVDVAQEMMSFDKYDGVVIQLPVPEGMDTQKILDSVPTEKDIDVLSTEAKKTGKPAPVARAVFEILDFYKISLIDKEVLVIGNGKLVGEPVCSILAQKNIPYFVIDKNTDEQVRQEKIISADIIISGAGVPHMIKPNMIKEGVVLIDAGTSEQSGKLVGDIDPACGDRASLITPVPGGVGPVTVVSLFANLL
jgi:methylenetetrahydrofolate dehydrogenase (NADP+)/methenyltetrahydrofolate cyclohydrolase